jgi:ABC-type Fe3+ transport system permease subunit
LLNSLESSLIGAAGAVALGAAMALLLALADAPDRRVIAFLFEGVIPWR